MLKNFFWWLLIGVMVVESLAIPASAVNAQTNTWSEPVNLSHSGAAEQPRVVASPSGMVQVFWWDRFDGLTTSYSLGTSWTVGISVPLDIDKAEMPVFVLDSVGRIHAFWQKQVQGVNQLWHASMRLADTTWTVIEKLTEATLGFKALAMEDGAMVVTYLVVAQSWGAPAGIYLQRLEPGMFVWNTPIGLDTSAYYRLETAETAWLHLAAEGEILTVTWREPNSGEYRAKTSINGGWNWGSIENLEPPGVDMKQPRSLYWNEGRILTWQDEGTSGCPLIQLSESGIWQAGLIGLSECPQADKNWSEDSQLFWLWGQGSRVIWLAAWDGIAWTQPLSLSFPFTDPVDDSPRNLQDLQVAQADGILYVAGSDGQGEVWFVKSELRALQLLEAPQPEWSMTSRLSSQGMRGGEPAIAVDDSGKFHVAWLEGEQEGIYVALYYTVINGETVGQSVVVKTTSAGEFLRQPALLADPAGWLHLAWSGGSRGEIHYSRVRLENANNPGAWSPVLVLSTLAGSSPQLARDSAGRLYLLYVTQLNESRGVYLVRSLDEGENWTEPELVFDAQAAGWANLGDAALAVAPSLDGGKSITLHIAWGEEALPSTLPPQGIWYTRANTSLEDFEILSWSTSFEVAGEGAAWPRLVITAGEVHLVFSLHASEVWERLIPLSAVPNDVSGWSTAVQVPGWEALPDGDGHTFGVTASGSAVSNNGVMHLVGLPTVGRLAYSRYSAGRWNDIEDYYLPDWSAGTASTVEAASLISGGQLGMTWVSSDESGLPAIFFAARAIPVMETQPEPPPAPVVQLEATPVIVSTPTIQPSPTPDLNQVPAKNISPNAPLIVGGGFAALIVVGYMLVRRRRN